MKKVLNIFFVTLGVIFFILILVGVYFYVTDPLNLKPIVFSESDGSTIDSDYDHPLLSDDQEASLEAVGIDPADVPSEISPEQEACFEDTLGSQRVGEIQAGDSPTATDLFKARDCL